MKKIMLIVLLFTAYNYASAQDVYTSSGKQGYQKKTKKKKGYDPDKLIIGGMPSLAFGDGYVNLGISALVGYRITDHFSAGVGLGYLYSRSPYTVDPYNPNNILYQTESVIYPNVWTRYIVYKGLYVTGSYEYDLIYEKLPLDNYGNVNATRSSATNSCVFLGIGYKQPLSGRLSVYIEGVYDVLQGVNSPYYPGQPQIHIGFAAGL